MFKIEDPEMHERYRSHLFSRANDCGIPEGMQDGLVHYVSDGLPPGHFLTAVLSNDLKDACGRADHINQRLLFNYVDFLYNYTPSPCWGSPEKVTEWLQRDTPSYNFD